MAEPPINAKSPPNATVSTEVAASSAIASPEQQTEQTQSTPPTLFDRISHAFSLSVRLALAGLVIYMGYHTAIAFRGMLTGPRDTVRQLPQDTDPLEARRQRLRPDEFLGVGGLRGNGGPIDSANPNSSGAAFQIGDSKTGSSTDPKSASIACGGPRDDSGWQVKGLDWRLRSGVLPTEQLDRRLMTIPTELDALIPADTKPEVSLAGATKPNSAHPKNPAGKSDPVDRKSPDAKATDNTATGAFSLQSLAKSLLGRDVQVGSLEQAAQLLGNNKDKDIVKLFAHTLKMNRAKLGPICVYWLVQEHMRAGMVTRLIDGQEQLALGRLAVPEGATEWRLYEAIPTGPTATAWVGIPTAEPGWPTADREPAFLLPMPTGSERLCLRWDGRGHVLGELIALPAPKAKSADDGPPQLADVDFRKALCENWKKAGWRLAPLPGKTTLDEGVLCMREADIAARRAGDLLTVWFIPSEDDKSFWTVFVSLSPTAKPPVVKAPAVKPPVAKPAEPAPQN